MTRRPFVGVVVDAFNSLYDGDGDDDDVLTGNSFFFCDLSIG